MRAFIKWLNCDWEMTAQEIVMETFSLKQKDALSKQAESAHHI